MAAALQEVIDAAREGSNPLAQPLSSANASGRLAPADMLETRRGEMPQIVPPPMPVSPQPLGVRIASPAHGVPHVHAPQSIPYPQAQPQNAIERIAPVSYPQVSQHPMYGQQTLNVSKKSSKLIWWIVGLLVLGAAGGAVLALVMR
jgi:hypothetical protein